MTGPARFLPAAEVARLFGVTVRTVRNWRRAGLLRPVRIRGRVYFSVEEIELLTGGRQRGQARTAI
jgi:DNA-binding transcriptional MerR regulator